MSTIYGGSGGFVFEDSPTSANLQKILIRCAQRVDSIQCVYDDETTTSYHGGYGGQEYIFYLDKDEAIIDVNIWAGRKIDALQFITTKSRRSEKFGGGGGSAFICRGFDGGEKALMGFRGRSGDEIDAIAPIWSTTRDLGPANVVVGDSRGGNGGSQFDMLQAIGDPLKTALKSIVIRSAARVDAIECQYQGDGTSGQQGGTGGSEKTFALGEDERIIRVEGRAGDRIDRLQFVTNKRQSDTYGGTGGTPFVWTPPFTGDDGADEMNMSLLCFQGRSMSEIDNLAPIWAIDPPISFELEITEFQELDSSTNGTPQQAWASEKTTDNAVSTATASTFTWDMESTRSTTISLTEDSRSKVGGKYTMSVTVEGKVGIPLIAEGDISTTAGIEVSGEHEWGKSVTDSEAVAYSFTEEVSETVMVPAFKSVRGNAIGYKFSADGLQWSGVMTVKYAGGATRQYDVDGTFDSANYSKIHTSYTEQELPPLITPVEH